MKIYVVYIVTNKPNGILYVGFTNDLKRRMDEHKQEKVDGFTKKYNLKRLVYFEPFYYVKNAIYREKQLKGWRRQWKIDLIEKKNVRWLDLYEEIFGVYSIDNKEGLDPESRSG